MTVAAHRPPSLYITAFLYALGTVMVLVSFDYGQSAESRVLFAVFLALVTAMAIRLGSLVAWSVAGEEVISARDGDLVVERRMAGRTRSVDRYPLAEVGHVRFMPISFWALPFDYPFARMPGSWGFGVGPVAFDHGSRVVRIAEGLRGVDEVALDLVKLIKKWIAESDAASENGAVSAST